MKKIFIDGKVGTTGLQIYERLANRKDIQLLEIPEEKRKDAEAKKGYLNEADLVILCLPDGAARESVSMIENEQVKVLDASTAHRTEEGWAYGLPELEKKQREKISKANRVSNPGCYPTGTLLAILPLVKSGIIGENYPVTVNAVSGYSGGGRKMIEQYEKEQQERKHLSFRPYELSLKHKHLPEMQKYSGLTHAPLFSPAVGNFHQGMLVSIPLQSHMLKKETIAEEVHEELSRYYKEEKFIRIIPFQSQDYLEGGFLSPLECNGTNRVDLFVFGNENQIMITARLDNLGKGASGAAVQNMNLMLGFEEDSGIELESFFNK